MIVPAAILDLWRGNAARLQHGFCDDCGAEAQVARQDRARRFQCVYCFAQAPTGSAGLRRRVREIMRSARLAERLAA